MPKAEQKSPANDKKLNAFLEDINRVCEKHRYQLRPTLKYGNSTIEGQIVAIPLKSTEEVRKNG